MSLWPARHPDGRLRGVPPDYRDQRMQFLQAIIHNAKGFSMYTYYYGQIYSSLIIGHEELGRTLQLIREYVFADTIPNGVTIKGAEPPAFQAGLKKVGKEFCLIAVNTSLKAQKVEFLLKTGFPEICMKAEEKVCSKSAQDALPILSHRKNPGCI